MSNSKFIDEMVQAHNEYRAKHQAPPLKHAQDLSDYAQNWANHLIAKTPSSTAIVTSKVKGWGKTSPISRLPAVLIIRLNNIRRQRNVNGKEPTDSWYSEIEKYDFNDANFKHGTGHFTQVVWKGSQEIGAARATDGKGTWIAVASYRPAGNMMGDFARNVLPPKDGKIVLPAKEVQEKSDKGHDGFKNMKHYGGGGQQMTDQRHTGSENMERYGGGGERKTQTKSYTRTEGGVTTTFLEETIVNPDGSTTTRKYTTTANSSR